MTVRRSYSVLIFIFSITSVLRLSYSQSGPCLTPDGDNGQCVVIRSCPNLLSMVRVRPLTPDITDFLRRSQCGYQNNSPKVCCPPPAIPPQGMCGKGVYNKIYGGERTDIDEFPWSALLEYTKPNGNAFHCEGVLVSPRYVLTAASCINNPSMPKTWRLTSVRLGEWNVSSTSDCSSGYCSDPPENVPVESTVIHEGYQTTNKDQHNDIALLRLARPVVFTEWVQPICLPLISQEIPKKNFVGEELYVAGWGKTETQSRSDVKLKVRLPVVSNIDCASVYSEQGFNISSTQLCAGGRKNQDSCRGDSGGSLMTQETENRITNWYAVGLVSFGPTNCGQEGWPGVHTYIAKYSNWLRRHIRP